MRRLAFIAAVAIVMGAALAGFAESTASAATPVPVSIQATTTQFFPTFSGLWQANGAINDSGSFVRTDVNLTGSFFNSPVVGAFQSVIVFSGSQGTLTVRNELVGTATSLTGVWQIASGTGAYAGASGHGTLKFVFPTIFYTGVISKTG